MAKKVRRVRKNKQSSAEQAPQAASAPSSKAAVTTDPTAEEFEQEYSYVLKDLRRVFILAAVMFVLLIALNLIIL